MSLKFEIFNYTEKEKELFNKYPKLFRRVELDMEESCMCWGLEIPDEWLPTIEQLCEDLNSIDPDAVEFEQIKSKFNMLRIYYDIVKDVEVETHFNISKLISRAEDKHNGSRKNESKNV